MKKSIAAALILVMAGAATAQARVNFNLNIDVPVPMAPVPVVTSAGYQTYPPHAPRPVVEVVPSFIYSPNLGFHVSVGTPYDIIYVDNGYYLYRDGHWHVGPSYRGPWSVVSQRWLPSGLHKHRHEQIRHYRDREYRSYLKDREHYRGSWYRPGQGRQVDYRYDHRDGRKYERGDGPKDRGRGDADHRRWNGERR